MRGGTRERRRGKRLGERTGARGGEGKKGERNGGKELAPP